MVVFLLRGGGRARVLNSPSAARPGGPGGTPTAPTPAASPVAAAIPTATAPGRRAADGAGSARAVASGWPLAGHDPGQSFASPNDVFAIASLPRLGLRWERTGASPAIALAGKVYAIEASTGKVTAYIARAGGVDHRYRSTGVQGLAAAGGLLYFNRGFEIRIVDAATGAWHYTAMATGPRVSQDRLARSSRPGAAFSPAWAKGRVWLRGGPTPSTCAPGGCSGRVPARPAPSPAWQWAPSSSAPARWVPETAT